MFTVPDDITTLQITARGAGGGTGLGASIEGPGGDGGGGSQVTGTLAVRPGEVLTVGVGQRGSDGGEGANCSGGSGGSGGVFGLAGGNGGGCGPTGASGGGGGQGSIVFGPSNVLLLIAAGGGGGGGAGAIDDPGGAGGAGGGANGANGVGTNQGFGGLSGTSSTSAGTDGGQGCDGCDAGAGGGGGGGQKGGAGGTAGGVGGGSGGGGGAGTDFISPSLGGVAVDVSPAGAGADGRVSITYTPPPFSTSTAVSCSPDPVAVDAPTTCTATVTDTEALVTTPPTGTVGFTSTGAGSFDASQCTLSGSGTSAQCSVTYTPSATGSHAIAAVYLADALHAESFGTRAVRVGLRSAATGVGCSPNPVAVGRSTTCTATVTDVSAGTKSTPTDIVRFSVFSRDVGRFDPDSRCTLAQSSPGVASCSVSYTPEAVGTGSHQILVEYAGDDKHAGGIFSQGDTSVTVTATKADCRHGGWRAQGFTSQGDCMAYVATAGKNEPGKNIPTPKKP